MAKKVVLSADSTCDIGPELQERFNVFFFNYHIQVGDKSYIDKVEISGEQLFDAWRKQGILPKTAAIAPGEFADHFKELLKDADEIVHINLGSGLSASYQNAVLAAEEVQGVYVVDSASLSSGSGLLVVKAGEMIAAGATGAEVKAELDRIHEKTNATFILDTLEFMAAGGRCSNFAAFGANLLKLKPCIKVDNQKAGLMSVGKKYRGAMERVLAEYVRDALEGRDDLDLSHIFVTTSGSPESDLALVRSEIKKYANFTEVHTTLASGTISAHCGPRTTGILFLGK